VVEGCPTRPARVAVRRLHSHQASGSPTPSHGRTRSLNGTKAMVHLQRPSLFRVRAWRWRDSNSARTCSRCPGRHRNYVLMPTRFELGSIEFVRTSQSLACRHYGTTGALSPRSIDNGRPLSSPKELGEELGSRSARTVDRSSSAAIGNGRSLSTGGHLCRGTSWEAMSKPVRAS
jgi:hypothetical protein